MLRVVLGGCLVAAVLAAPAGATTYCVGDPACPPGGVVAATPQAALTSANATADEDTVRLGPGVFAGPFEVRAGTTLIGAGRGETTVVGPVTGALLRLGTSGVAQDLELRLTDDAIYGISDAPGGSGVAERIDIDGTTVSDQNAVGITVGIDRMRVSDTRIAMAGGTAIRSGNLLLQNAEVRAPFGLRHFDYSARLSRVLFTGRDGLRIERGTVTADAVAVVAEGTAVQTGLGTGAAAGILELRHGTLLGSRDIGVAVRSAAACTSAGTTTLIDSAIEGFATQILRTGEPGSSGCGAADANVDLNRVAYDPVKVAHSGPGALTTSGTLATTALGLGPDRVPQPGSPLIDAGDPFAAPGLDLLGAPRPFGSAPDLGAYEYQGPQPTPTPEGTPAPTATTVPPLRIRPRRVRLTARPVAPLEYRVRATVVSRRGDCEGGEAVFRTRRPRGVLRTTFDAACHADVTVRARPGTRLSVRFGGTATLEPKRSRTKRLR